MAGATLAIQAEMVANVVSVDVEVGATVAAGDAVVLLESMKMEIPVLAETGGVVTAIKVGAGDVVQEGDVLLELAPA
ncbi:biotin/lipoyl-binding carrier protein [Nocardioides panacisoli]|uniref:Biotin/lipoyl-binding carrier protein n=1 Tax=Nocardioides panacisoli TaxID=627624 RepID=A0ABP7II77_9ACTN